MTLFTFQKGFNYAQDGPGNRLVYHLSGCNLHCPWCANPEGMLRGRGRETAVALSDMLEEILAARALFFDGGGVTFTGGEATTQSDALLALLARVREHGVNACVETNGTMPGFAALLDALDILIMDLKHPNAAEHKRWTGSDNDVIMANIRMAARTSLPLHLRVPLIHGVNDDDATLVAFADFFAGVNRPGVTVEGLPYHEYGKGKWAELGLPYAMRNAFISPETAMRFDQLCGERGLRVIHT